MSNLANKWNIGFKEPILVSTMEGNVTAHPTQVDNIDDLCMLICTKNWSPGIFRGKQRTNENFEFIQVLGLDVDGGCSMTEAKKRLAGYKYIIAPTRSHNVEKNGITSERFRIILFLSEPINDATTYHATWSTAYDMFPWVDRACKDVSRQFFKSLYIEDAQDGELFLVMKPTPKPPTIRLLPQGKYPIPNYALGFMSGSLNESWNVALFKASKLMQEAGYDLDETVELMSKMTNSKFSGELDQSDMKTIRSAFAKEGKYDPVVTFPVKVPSRSGDLITDPRSQDNFIFLAENYLKLNLRFNELRNSIEVDNRMWEDSDFSAFRMKCRDFRLLPTTEILDDVINHIAHKNKYNPFKSQVSSTVWDGKDRFEELYQSITLDGEDLPIYRDYLKKWVIGIIARTYSVKPAYNNVLVLKGPQGSGKSRWLERFGVAEGTFNEGPIDPASKDDRIKATSIVVWSISELDYVTRKKDQGAIKSFLTDTKFDVRMPYGRYSKQVRAIASYAASVNEDHFLVDTTGNRRFLVLPVKALNADHKVDMLQLYAQALQLFNDGVRYYYLKDEIEEINTINESYIPENKMDFIADKIKSGTDEVNLDDIFTLVGYKDSRSPYDYSNLGKVLIKNGIPSKRKIVSGKKRTVYLINKKELGV